MHFYICTRRSHKNVCIPASFQHACTRVYSMYQWRHSCHLAMGLVLSRPDTSTDHLDQTCAKLKGSFVLDPSIPASALMLPHQGVHNKHPTQRQAWIDIANMPIRLETGSSSSNDVKNACIHTYIIMEQVLLAEPSHVHCY